jgi:hypothetical protein
MADLLATVIHTDAYLAFAGMFACVVDSKFGPRKTWR